MADRLFVRLFVASIIVSVPYVAACSDDDDGGAADRSRLVNEVERALYVNSDLNTRICRCLFADLGFATENACVRANTFSSDEVDDIRACYGRALDDVAGLEPPGFGELVQCERVSLDRAYTCLEETPESCSDANLQRALDCVEDLETRSEACWTLLDARVYERALDDALDDRCSGLL